MDIEDSHLYSNSAHIEDSKEGFKMDTVNNGFNQVNEEHVASSVNVDQPHSELETSNKKCNEWDTVGCSDDLPTSRAGDNATEPATAGFTSEQINALTEDVPLVWDKTNEHVASGDSWPSAMESGESTEETASINNESSEFLLDGGSWEEINWTEYGMEQEDTESSGKGDYSDSSTLCADSLNASIAEKSTLKDDSFTLDTELMEPDLNTDGINLLSFESVSSGLECMETFDLGTVDVSLVPMESLHLSLASSSNLLLGAAGSGSASLHCMNLGMTAADWHMGSVPVKCLQLGAVNVASLTLGTVGISVFPMVSARTIDIHSLTESIGVVPMESIDWETVSSNSETLTTTLANHINVDSVTPDGVRERWHPLEDRLYALGEALTALDKKIEGFSPRLQEAETLLNDMECSLTQHVTHISAIVTENNALSQRIMQLENRVTGEKQHHILEGGGVEDN